MGVQARAIDKAAGIVLSHEAFIQVLDIQGEIDVLREPEFDVPFHDIGLSDVTISAGKARIAETGLVIRSFPEAAIKADAPGVEGVVVYGGIILLPAEASKSTEVFAQFLIHGKTNAEKGVVSGAGGVGEIVAGALDSQPIISLAPGGFDTKTHLFSPVVIGLIRLADIRVSDAHPNAAQGPRTDVQLAGDAGVEGGRDHEGVVDEGLVHELADFIVGEGIVVHIGSGVDNASGKPQGGVLGEHKGVFVPGNEKMVPAAPVDIAEVVFQVVSVQWMRRVGRDGIEGIPGGNACHELEPVSLRGVKIDADVGYEGSPADVIHIRAGEFSPLIDTGDRGIDGEGIGDIIGGCRKGRKGRQ